MNEPLPPLFPPAHQVRDQKFDLLPPIGKECAYALHAKFDAKPSMIYTAILGALTAAAGPLYLFKPPDRHAHSISSWTIVKGPSGSAKTDVNREMAKPFLQQADERRARHVEHMHAFDTAHAEWKFSIQRLQRRLGRKGINDIDANGLQQELKSLRTSEPVRPKERPLLATDFDHESFMSLAHGRNEVIAIFPNEGDRVVRGRWLASNAETLNEIHDGGTPPVYRREKKAALEAVDTHLSMNLYVRPSVLDRFKPTYRGDQVQKAWLVELGFFARFRISFDDERPKQPWLYRPPSPDACIATFQAQLGAFLARHGANQPSGTVELITLELEPEALPYWGSLVSWVKNARLGELAHIDEFVGKMLVHAGSLATAIHVAESDSTLVSLKALERAWTFMLAFADHYAQVFAPPPSATTLDRDGRRIEEYLRSQFGRINYQMVDLEHMGYMLAIPKQRVLAVVHHLVHYGHASFNAQAPGTIDVSPMFGRTRSITLR